MLFYALQSFFWIFFRLLRPLDISKMPFNDISGHTREILALKNAIATDRVAHAYLFSGPARSGKGLVAKTFAMALNCSASSPEPCGVCSDCVRITDSTHQNLTEIGPSNKDGLPDPGGLIRIAEVRRLQGALRYRVESGAKVVIIDAADRLQPQAAHAFLKTLEEPPPNSVLILVSARPSALLPTVLSRCQRVNFRPLEESIVRDFLMEHEALGAEEGARLAHRSAGSLGIAIEYAGSDLYSEQMEVALRVESLGPDETLRAMELADELSKRDGLTGLLDFLKMRYRDRIAALLGAGSLAVTEVAFGEQAEAEELIEAYSLIEAARVDIASPCNVNRLLRLEALFFSIMGLTGSTGSAAVAAL